MSHLRMCFLTSCAIGLFLTASPALANYAVIRGTPVTQGQMRVAEKDLQQIRQTQADAPDQFILTDTRVEMEISGVLARVRVEHVFVNPYPDRLEAVYVFPLPEDAAVDRYWFQVGDKVVRGVVKERGEARRRYEQAKSEGRKAALLEQERANIFSQSVANIPPQGTITVHIEYVHQLQIDGDRYAVRFPMVVAPRFIPGQPAGRANVGRGWANDTDEVPDASKITPVVFPKGQRGGNDVHINIKIDAGMPIRDIVGVSHELETKKDEKKPGTAVVDLKNKTTIADRDFIVEFRLAGEDPAIASLAHRDQSGGYFTLVLQPKWKTASHELSPREVVLLLDTSGSMSGVPISQLRMFAQHVLDTVNPQDTIRVVSFSSQTASCFPQAKPATAENIEAGKQFIRTLKSGGGTRMLPALKAALGSSGRETDRVRYLVLVTDALVGNDNSILGYLKRSEFSDVRVFPVAMGSAPNHYLISRAAELSRGFSMQVTNQDNVGEMATRFAEKISSPCMTDLEIDFGGLVVHDVLPGPMPDLYAGRPLVVMGRYDKPGKGRITLRGNMQGQAIETKMEMVLPEKEQNHDCLGPLWARNRIRQIWNRDLGKQTSQGKDEITRLGIDHQLVTRYTSFIAVEEEAVEVPVGKLRSQQVRVLLPDGMDEAAVGQGITRSASAKPPHAAKPSPTTASRDSKVNPPADPPAPASMDPAPAAGDSSLPGLTANQSVGGSNDSGTASRPGTGGRSGRSGGGGGGGSVEWLYLACMGGLIGGRLLCRKAKRPRSNY